MSKLKCFQGSEEEVQEQDVPVQMLDGNIDEPAIVEIPAVENAIGDIIQAPVNNIEPESSITEGYIYKLYIKLLI